MTPEDFARQAARIRLDYREALRGVDVDMAKLRELEKRYGQNAIFRGPSTFEDGLAATAKAKLDALAAAFLADADNRRGALEAADDETTRRVAEEALDREWATGAPEPPFVHGVNIYGRIMCTNQGVTVKDHTSGDWTKVTCQVCRACKFQGEGG